MTNIVVLEARRQALITKRENRDYSQYLGLLDLPELIHEARYLIKEVQLRRISAGTMAKIEALMEELTGANRVAYQELLTCQSLKALREQLNQSVHLLKSQQNSL